MDVLSYGSEFLLERPLVLILVASLPLILTAWLRKSYPTQTLLMLACLPALLSFATRLSPQVIYWVAALDLAIFAIALSDLLMMIDPRQFQINRRLERVMSLGKSQRAEIEVIHNGDRPVKVELTDDLPDDFIAEPATFCFLAMPRSRTQWQYRLTSSRRGLFTMSGIHIRIRSRFGLWDRFHFFSCPGEVHVYPDLQQITEYAILARTNRLSLLGVRRSRKIGRDNEFERLRDYARDDNHRFIDWRASARKQKLMVKDFQTNQNQSIVFLVDCGRMMTGLSGRFSMLDHALNAMLMMTYVALQRGDSVGLLTFSDRVHHYTPPQSGAKHLNRILHATFDQQAEYVESRYDEAFLYLNRHCRKRSLVILMTNLIDEVNASQVREYLGHAALRHLPLGVFLRDHDLFSPLEKVADERGELLPVESGQDRRVWFEAAAAAEIAKWRHQALSELNHGGTLTLDTFPEQLTASLINRYLEIKARHLL